MCMLHNDGATSVPSGVRLPDTVTPEHYKIVLSPDLTKFTFEGDEVIDIKVKAPVSEIVLNATELNITDAFVTDAFGTTLRGKVSLDAETERATIAFDGVVGKGKWKLFLRFDGVLNDKLHGFYRSTYKDAGGKEHVIASTQFEPNDARRAFPCFDEPSFKATFGITLIVDEHLTAISNGPIIETHSLSSRQGKKAVVFKDTMKMSTYIVAFVVGEFEATDPVVVNGTEVRIYHTPGKGALTTFALKAAQFSLSWYERYFRIRYPGDKLDLIGIPDFAFGAMENLGCVTYRETALLVNEKTANIAALHRVAEVVSHENAHMWFGNLVTMKWWNGLWLNEAFATFMAAKVVDEFRKEWKVWDRFGLERGAALRTDGLGATRPIEAVVTHPAQALGMIDVITYRKGCSVLRQLEQYMGEEKFRQGIEKYLKANSYGNAETTDLWEALDSVTDQPVAKIMSSWVFQPGYPVVSVSEGTVDGTVTLKQSPFKYLSNKVAAQTWLVPVLLRYKTDEGVASQWVLLDAPEKTIYLGEDLDWVVANAGGHGFYRTQYSPSLAAKVMANVNSNLSAIERFNLVNDAWACVLAGISNSSDYLNMVSLFKDDSDPNVWEILLGSFGRIHSTLPESNRSTFEAMVSSVVGPALSRLGWDQKPSDTPQDRQLRGSLISTLGTIGGDATVQAKARELYAKYKADKTSVPNDIVPALIGLVAYSGGQAEYDEFLAAFQASTVPQEQIRYLFALAGFRDRDLLSKTLAATLTPTVRSQDGPHLIVRLLGNDTIATQAWEFLKANWSTFVKRFPETGVISMTSGVTALSTPELEAEVVRFFTDNPVKGGEKAVAQNLEQLRINVLFGQRETQSLAARFAAPTAEPSAEA